MDGWSLQQVATVQQNRFGLLLTVYFDIHGVIRFFTRGKRSALKSKCDKNLEVKSSAIEHKVFQEQQPYRATGPNTLGYLLYIC